MERESGSPPRHTRIVATVGRCAGPSWPIYLDALAHAGADVLRLNMSHASEGYAKEREILGWCNGPAIAGGLPRVAALGDLSGPKARIGHVADAGVPLEVGGEVTLRPGTESDDPAMVPVPEPIGPALLAACARELCRGGGALPRIYLGDGELVLDVIEAGPQGARCRVAAGGTLRSRKGIALRGVDLDLEPFTDKDRRDLAFLLEAGVTFLAVSFVRTADDLRRVRAYARDALGHTQRLFLIAKIETVAAADNAEAILAEADGIMVARGDLGLQLPLEAVPNVQKRLARLARSVAKPCVVATQMLESMTRAFEPTRAEASDVFNAILDGADAVMLSGETSIGDHPEEVVRVMDRLARAAEANRRAGSERLDAERRTLSAAAHASSDATFWGRVNEDFALSAVQFAERIPARAIVSFSRTGSTTRRLARYRSVVPLLAVCKDLRVARELLLCYGVLPVPIPLSEVREEGQPGLTQLLVRARDTLRTLGRLQPGDALVVTAGIDAPKGTTNTLRVVVEG